MAGKLGEAAATPRRLLAPTRSMIGDGAGVFRQAGIPIGIGSVGGHAPVEIGSAIRPPDRTTLPEPMLGGINRGAGPGEGVGVTGPLGGAYRSSGIHQVVDEPIPPHRVEIGPLAPPEPAAHDDVAPVRRLQHSHRGPISGEIADIVGDGVGGRHRGVALPPEAMRLGMRRMGIVLCPLAPLGGVPALGISGLLGSITVHGALTDAHSGSMGRRRFGEGHEPKRRVHTIAFRGRLPCSGMVHVAQS